jgi:large subunit ribosomal protein L4
MKFKLYNNTGSSNQEKEVADFPVFEGNRGVNALRQVIIAHQANARQGNASTKTRADVSGTGKKAFRQKGTGGARRGNRRSPIMKGGGVAFGPKPRDYSQKLNKKIRKLALGRALFEQANNGSIDLIEDWIVAEPKTRIVSGILNNIAPNGKVLMLGDDFSNDALLACRNIPRLSVTRSSDVNALDLVHHDHIIVSEKGLETVLERAKC